MFSRKRHWISWTCFRPDPTPDPGPDLGPLNEERFQNMELMNIAICTLSSYPDFKLSDN